MKKNLLILIKQKFDKVFGTIFSVQKRSFFLTGVLTLVLLFKPFSGFSQADGDMRSAKTGGGYGVTGGTFEVYNAVSDTWTVTAASTAWVANTAYTVGTKASNGANLYIVTIAGTSAASGGPTGTTAGIVDGTVTWDYVGSAAVAPGATTNVTIMEGVFQTSNNANWNALNLNVGQGNAFSGTAVLTGTAVTSVTVKNAGALMANPGVTFIGPGTTVAAGYVTYKYVGAYFRNKGTGYTNATVTFNITAWAANTAYAVGVTRSIGGNLYNSVVAGTSSKTTGGPTGTGAGIVDSTVTWNYVGTVPTATATVSGGQVTGITITNPGSGIICGTAGNSATLPGITIGGDGTGASYAPQMGVDGIVITAGGNYTVPPTVLVGSVMMVGNGTTNRAGTVNGNLTIKNGANFVTGGGSTNVTSTLNLLGDLIAESPVSFITVVPTSTSQTNVNFNKAGTSTISGNGLITFRNMTVGGTTTLVNNGNVVVVGTTNFISADIGAFNFTTPPVTGVINKTNHTISLTVPFGTDVTALTPTISLTNQALGTVSPDSAVVQNFTNPVVYHVTAQDGIMTQDWTASVTIAPALSTDATLTALAVAGNTLSPTFSAGTLTYSVALPFGTTIGTLPAVTYTPAANATALKTDATVLPGATTIKVTAQDGTTIKTYTINFTVTAASTDATLNSLAVAGYTLSPVFSAATLTYDVVLPMGTTVASLPAVTYITAANATAVKTDATVLPGATTIVVTAQDNTTTKTYTINFTVTPASTDATLTALAVTGKTLSPAFSPATLTYTVVLPALTGIGNLPAVTYTPAANATAVKTDATALPGATTIVVTAQDGTTTKTYTINFTLNTGVKNAVESLVKLYPVPASNSVTIEVPQSLVNSTISVYNILGGIQSEQLLNGTKLDIDLSGFAKGIYFVKIVGKDGASILKQIVKQ